MLGANHLNSSAPEGAFLSPLQQLKAQPQPCAPFSPRIKSSSANMGPTPSLDSDPYRDSGASSASVKEYGTSSQQFTLLFANQIHVLRKLNRLLTSSTEVMDEFAMERQDSAGELRNLLAPLFSEMELLLIRSLDDLLKLRKNESFDRPNSAVFNSTPTVAPSNTFPGPKEQNLTALLPPDPAIMTPVFRPQQIEKLGNTFQYLHEEFKEKPHTSRPATPALNHFHSSVDPTHFSLNQLSQNHSEPSTHFFNTPSSTLFPSNESHASKNSHSFFENDKQNSSSFPNEAFMNSSVSHKPHTTPLEAFKKLGFSSTINLPSSKLPSSSSVGPSPVVPEKSFPPLTSFPGFGKSLDSSTSLSTASPIVYGSDELSNSADAFNHLTFGQSSTEVSSKQMEPSQENASLPTHRAQLQDHLEILNDDLFRLIEAEKAIIDAEDEFGTKELYESMAYHAHAIVKQKFEASSSLKFDFASLREDLKAYSKKHAFAYEYGLNTLALVICTSIREMKTLDKNIITICNTIANITGLSLRIFSFLYLLTPELRHLVGFDYLSKLPVHLKEKVQVCKCNQNSSIFFASLALRQFKARMETFYLNPIFKSVETILTHRPPKESTSFHFVMTVLEFASHDLLNFDAPRFEAILDTLKETYGVDGDEFGYNEPEKVWPYFVYKEDWPASDVLGFYVQFGSESALRKLHQEAASFILDPSVTVDKKMGLKLKPLLSQLTAEAKWVKKVYRVAKQAFAMFPKDNERALLSSVISVWILRPDTNVIDIRKLSQGQLSYLSQVLFQLFSIYRVFKIALFHMLFQCCPLLVPGEFVTNDIAPEVVIAYGRFWATLAITIPWFGEPNSYFVSPIFMLLENLPTHPRSELLALTILEVSESVLKKYKSSRFEQVIKDLCTKYSNINTKYQKSRPPASTSMNNIELTPAINPETASNLETIRKKIQTLTREEVPTLTQTVSEMISSDKSSCNSRQVIDTVISTILDRMDPANPPDINTLIFLTEFTFSLIEKHTLFYTSFMATLLERCPLLNIRNPITLVGNAEKLTKYLLLIPFFVILNNHALLRGSTVLNALDLLRWYEHVIRSGATLETADILCSALKVSQNFLTNERFKNLMGYVRDNFMRSLPETPGKQALAKVLNCVFAEKSQ